MSPMSGKLYDRLKWVVMIVLPAVATLYLSLGQLWDFPETEKVVASITLITTFLGTVLQLSSSKYNKSAASFDGYLGSSGIDPDTGIPNLKMVVTTAPDDLLHGKVARLKIGSPPEN